MKLCSFSENSNHWSYYYILKGDSGGPLMTPQIIDGQSYFYQIGVVSYGIGCARVEVPGVYTSVQYFVDWVQETVANNWN